MPVPLPIRRLLVLICLAAPPGCGFSVLFDHDEADEPRPAGDRDEEFKGYLRAGLGSTTVWSTPTGVAEPSPYLRADAAWTWETPAGLTTGASVQGAGGDELLATVYLAWDMFGLVGWFGAGINEVFDRLFRGEPRGYVSPYPIVKPVVGIWSWSESPGDVGLVTGLETGVFVYLPGGDASSPGWAFTLEYGWWSLYGASAGDVHFQTLGLNVLVPF